MCRFTTPKNIFLLLFAFHFLLPAPVYRAQDSSFQKLSIGFSFSRNVNKTSLDEFWNKYNQYGALVRSPFYSGNIEIGFSYTPFTSKNFEQPDFKLLMYYIQWDKPLFNSSIFEAAVGCKIGLSQMIFEETDEISNSSDIYEHEILAGIIASLRYNISSEVQLDLKVNYVSILTKKTINLFYTGAGVCYTFDTPKWLRDFLK